MDIFPSHLNLALWQWSFIHTIYLMRSCLVYVRLDRLIGVWKLVYLLAFLAAAADCRAMPKLVFCFPISIFHFLFVALLYASSLLSGDRALSMPGQLENFKLHRLADDALSEFNCARPTLAAWWQRADREKMTLCFFLHCFILRTEKRNWKLAPLSFVSSTFAIVIIIGEEPIDCVVVDRALCLSVTLN